MENSMQKISYSLLSIVMIPMILILLVGTLQEAFRMNPKNWIYIGLISHILFVGFGFFRLKQLNLEQTTKAIWSLVILLFPIIGTLASIYITSEIKQA